MTTLRLNRFISGPDGTFGTITYKSRPLCDTCEDPWFQNKNNISCIPTGTYECVKHNGPKYKDVWVLRNVPGRIGVLLHWGNTIKDTQGCILIGNGWGTIEGLPGVVNSKPTFEMLRRTLPTEFDLVITGPSGMDYKY